MAMDAERRAEYARWVASQRVKVPITCEVCGTVKMAYPTATVCSAKCAQKRRRQRLRDQPAQPPEGSEP